MPNDVNNFQILLEEKYGDVLGDVFLVLITGTLCCSLIKEWGGARCRPIVVLYEDYETRNQVFNDLKIFAGNHELKTGKNLETALAEVHDDIAFIVGDIRNGKEIEVLEEVAEMGKVNGEQWTGVLILSCRYTLPEAIGEDWLLIPLWRTQIRCQLDIQKEKKVFLQRMVKFVMKNQDYVRWKWGENQDTNLPVFLEKSVELIGFLYEREQDENESNHAVEQLRDSVEQWIRMSEETADNTGLAEAFLREFNEAYLQFRFIRYCDVAQCWDLLDEIVIVTDEEFWMTEKVFAKISSPLLSVVCLRQIKQALKDEKILKAEGGRRNYFTLKESFLDNFGIVKRVRLLHLYREKIDVFGELTLLEISENYWKEDEHICKSKLVRK